MKHFITTLLLLIAPLAAMADVPLSYYASANGQKKEKLKAALHRTIQAQRVLSYGSGEGSTWSGFYQTDRLPDGEVRDRYSNDHRYFASGASTQKASAVSGMNIEHSFPKSWWGGTTNNAYKDLFNLMPCESTINSAKSNYAMGIVTQVAKENGCTKVGKGTTRGGTTKNLWEPADRWKGDFARAYMYMATTYSDFTWTSNGLDMLEQNEWPTLQQWAYTLLVKWNREDPVDAIEVARNEAVYKIQGNRNPFVDFPNLAEYVWGDSTARAFDVNTTLKSSNSTEGGGTVDPIVPDVPDDELDPQYDSDGNLLNIDALLAECKGTSSGSGAEVTYRFDNLLVTYANGRNIFVGEGERGFLLYGNNSLGLKAGDRISGTLTGTDYYYYRLPELSFGNLDDVSIVSRNNAVAIADVTIATLQGSEAEAYYSRPVRLWEVTPSASTFSSKKLTVEDAKGAEVLLFDTWQTFTDATFSPYDEYEVIGIPVIYNSTVEIYPISIVRCEQSGVAAVTDSAAPCPIYDFSGRRVQRRDRGMLIVNGRKHVF